MIETSQEAVVLRSLSFFLAGTRKIEDVRSLQVYLGESDGHCSNLTISTDHGETWSVGTTYPYNNTESQAVLLGSGKIMLNCRTESSVKYRTVIVTSDLGQTWQPHPTNRNTLIEPGCNGSICRFNYNGNGRKIRLLVFANPHSQAGRVHYTIHVSLDDGMTWPRQYNLLLDEGRGRGYPSLIRIVDQHVGIAYEGSQSDLVFERISIDELLGQR